MFQDQNLSLTSFYTMEIDANSNKSRELSGVMTLKNVQEHLAKQTV